MLNIIEHALANLRLFCGAAMHTIHSQELCLASIDEHRDICLGLLMAVDNPKFFFFFSN